MWEFCIQVSLRGGPTAEKMELLGMPINTIHRILADQAYFQLLRIYVQQHNR